MNLNVNKGHLKMYEIMFIISTILIVPQRIFTYYTILPNTTRLIPVTIAIIAFLLGIYKSPSVLRSNMLTFSILIIVFTYINYHGQWYGFLSYREKMYAYSLFFLPMLLSLFYFYSDRISVKKRLLNYILLLECITLVTTLIGLQIYPNASRDLASTVAIDDYKRMNIGGYEFIYGLVLLIPSLKFLLYNSIHKAHRLLLNLFFLFSFVCIVLSQYTTALIVAVGMLLFNRIRKVKNKNYRFTMYILLSFIFLGLLLSSELILNSLSCFFHEYELDAVAQKFDDILSSSQNRELIGTVDSRAELFSMSFHSFIESPLIGKLIDKQLKIGGHSEVLDILASGGAILGFITYLTMKNYRKIVRGIGYSNEFENHYFLAYLAFLIIATFDTVLNSPVIAINLFLVPSLCDNRQRFIDYES